MEYEYQDFDRRRDSFLNLVNRFCIRHADALAFIAGWTAYPIGAALLALMGFR